VSTTHDEIVAAFLSVLAPMQGELRLLSRLADPVIGNDTDDAFLFVPDLHLITDKRQAHYGSYGFNYRQKGVLEKLLQSLVPLRRKWKAAGTRTLLTVQLGDFFDLWRELKVTESMATIPDDAFAALRDVLYRGVHRGLPCLQAVMLLGNHDTHAGEALTEISPLMLKAFNRSASGKPFLFMTHGDCFDLLEVLAPDAIEAFAVHILGRLTPTTRYSIGDWSKAAGKVNKPIASLRDSITKPDHALDHLAVKVTPGADLPTDAVKRVSPGATDRRFDDYYRALLVANARATDVASVRVIVAGHTHEAGMMLCAPPHQRPLLLMDCGAWIERCSYTLFETGKEVTEPSAQLGVIHGNDARIYQVRFPA
jgi:UDP-2,3-diacylglucosamine pyrophosphatase LpxH